ncbi:MAG: hypothetical protein ACT4PL_01095 [Phycisphaerales bacterium]
MNVRDTIDRLNRAQRTRAFKIGATVLAVLLAIAAVVTYGVRMSSMRADLGLIELGDGAPEAAAPLPENATADDKERQEVAKALRDQYESVVRSLNAIRESSLSMETFAIGTGIVLAVMLVIIWLGLALTYLAAAALAVLVAGPMVLWGGVKVANFGWFILGSLALWTIFSALIEGLRAALSASHPITSIARNVVSESVRMRISLVFIVLLIFGLAALPLLLDDSKALRYRVQSFLTWGIGGTYWLIAILTVFLACATVAFEQRDKIIWQTMTKPVRAFEYVLGKWIGVVGVAAVLLVVSASGALMFTEYLRRQPAIGETRPFVSADPQVPVTHDRLLLETQVLTAQATALPTLPALDMELREKAYLTRVERTKADNPLFVETAEERARILGDMDKEQMTQYFNVDPGQYGRYLFEGLLPAKLANAPVTLRFKVRAGSDLPTDTYRLTFQPVGSRPFIREVRLGQVLTEPLPPTAVQFIKDGGRDGGDDGQILLEVFNGDLRASTMNKEPVSFATGTFEITYPVGGFIPNFARVVVVMWLKIAFLAMVGVCAATFLSFSVASLTSFGVFLCAEGAAFLSESLESFNLTDSEHGTLWWRYPIAAVAKLVTTVFGSYSELQPVESLVEGRIVEWQTVVFSLFVLGIASAVLWAMGTFIFQRRELATYSGQ